MKRPEWIVCALTGMFDGPDKPIWETWCGRKLPGNSEFLFTDASHAALNARRGGRLVLCPRCRKAIVAALESQAEASAADSL